ncbi:MAG TPA: DUF1499 domain-containing protein [Thermoanaerobaculia bacterium]|nr:DUF1499 domain-containing protein [Thermoanaerobaculia bacterium]
MTSKTIEGSSGGTRLRPCPSRPNCVSSRAEPGTRPYLEPIPYQGSLAAARERLQKVLLALPRTRIVAEEPAYLHAECRSRVFRFVDDVEFEFDEPARKIHFRSAARLGYRDFDVNRLRIEEIRRAFLAAG